MVFTMSYTFSIWMEAFILVVALSLDSFVASFAYGTNKVKIPLPSLLIIDAICSGTLLVFLYLGSILSPFLPDTLVAWFCFAILLILGLVKLFDSSLKIMIQKLKNEAANVHFSFCNLKFILTVYADPNKANADNSGRLSPLESISLAIALSFDSAAVGFGAGVGPISFFPVLILSLIAGAAAVKSGSLLGWKFVDKTNLNLSWLSGVLLILLAFLKLF